MKFLPKLHYVVSLALALLVVPAVLWTHLPPHVAWGPIIRMYWLNMGLKSILLCCIFCVFSLPLDQTIKPFLRRCRTQRLRVPLLAGFAILEIWSLGIIGGCILFMDGLFLIEVLEREQHAWRTVARRAGGTLVAATYMFFATLLVFIYNDVIVAARPWVSYDQFFNRVDSRLLFGTDVCALAHAALARWSHSWMIFLDRAYFQMFFIVGATLLITSWNDMWRGLRFVGACLSANYIALLIFYLWPTYGPFLNCTEHLSRYSADLISFRFQQAALSGFGAIWKHRTTVLGAGFYIAFPSLHIASPVIAMWFLRRWRVAATMIGLYNVLLLIAIPVLEWHYVIDLFAGIALGCLAICISTGCSRRRKRPEDIPVQA